MKVLYLYSGDRAETFHGVPGVDFPDTQWYGQNHFVDLGIEADYKDGMSAAPRVLRNLLGFRLRHLFLFFSTRKYDIVYGSALLYMIVLKKFIPTRAKYVLFNISLLRTLRVHSHRTLYRKSLEYLLKELDGIVCVSTAQKQWLESTYPYLSGKVFVVPLGVDVSFYHPVFSDRSSTVLAVGRDDGRDYATLIEVARQLPDHSFEIVCSRRNLAGIHAIPPNVRVYYDMPLLDLYKKYQSAALMLIITHSDTYTDGADCSGQTVLLDSMANGIPVIVTRRAYLDEYVRDGVDARIIEAYDTGGIIAAINELSHDEQLRYQLATNARRRVESSLSTKRMAQHLASVFRSIFVVR